MNIASEKNLRKSGIEIIGDIPWSTHLCQFYETRDDLAEIVASYLKAGLENNEHCVWITSETIDREGALSLLKKHVPGFDRYLKKGQMDIIPYTDWYLRGGAFEMRRVLSDWIDTMNGALARGFDGLRVTGNTVWIKEEDWQSFAEYEKEINRVIGNYPLLVLCTYPLEKCTPSSIIDVVSSHQSALIRREGNWGIIDIVGRKESDEALRASAARHRSYIEVTGQLAWTTNAAGEIVEDLPSWRNYTGQTHEEIKGWGWADALHPDDFFQTMQTWKKATETRSNYEAEYRLRRHDGVYRHFLARGIPVFREDGVIREWVGACIDITERKRMEEELREAHNELKGKVVERTNELFSAYRKLDKSNELLEKLFASANFLIAYLDADFNFIKVNEAYAKTDGRPAEFFTGKNHFDLYPHEENRRIFERVVASGEPFSVFAKPFEYAEHPERGITYWDWSLIPLKGDGGQVESLLFCLIDVTKKKKAEEDLARAHIELAHARRLSDLGALAATIAHEMRNPLAAIKTAAYNLRRKLPDAGLEKHLQTIDKKVAESDTIIRNLLNFAKIKLPIFEEVRLHDLLKDCLATVALRYSGWNVSLRERFDDSADVPIKADPVQLTMVFSNIIDNAFQALPDKSGTITVSAGHDRDRRFRISVQDTGTGIETVDIDKIFEPFFTRKTKGTGLGLAITKQIVDLHQGEIMVESARGAGTTFTVTLPAE